METSRFAFKPAGEALVPPSRDVSLLTLQEPAQALPRARCPLSIAAPLPYLERQSLQREVMILITANVFDDPLGSECSHLPR